MTIKQIIKDLTVEQIIDMPLEEISLPLLKHFSSSKRVTFNGYGDIRILQQDLKLNSKVVEVLYESLNWLFINGFIMFDYSQSSYQFYTITRKGLRELSTS